MDSNITNAYQKLSQRLISRLSAKVYAELEAFTEKKSEEKFLSINEMLNRRFERLNEEILAWTELEESGQELDLKEIQKRFFEIANPKEMHEDLERTFHFTEINLNYDYYLSKMKDQPNGSLFKMLSLSETSFQYLKAQIVNQAEPAFEALELYSELVKNHFDLIRSERSSRGFKFFVKLIFKGMSFAVLGPMGSIGAGLFVNALFDQSTAIGQSMNDVAEQYDEYEVTLKESLNNMETAYRYVLLALYGGSLLKVNEAIANQYLEIHSLNLIRNEFKMKYIEAEEVNSRLWAERQIYIIKRKIDEDKLFEAHQMTDRFYHYIKSKPAMMPVLLKNGRSIGRESFLLKYLVITKIADKLKKQGNPGWVDFIGNMFKQLPHTVKMNEAKEYDVKLPAEWGMLLVHHALVKKQPELIKAYSEYTYKIVRRKLNDWDILEDEQLDEGEVDWNMVFGYAVSLYSIDNLKWQDPLETYYHHFEIDRSMALELRKWYLETSGKDSMSRYLWIMLQLANAAVIIKPVQNVMEKVGSLMKTAFSSMGNWLSINGGKMIKTSIKLAAILLLLYGGYQYKDKFLDVAADLKASVVAESAEEELSWDDESISEDLAVESIEVEAAHESIVDETSSSSNEQVEEPILDSLEENIDEIEEGNIQETVAEADLETLTGEVASDAVSEEELAQAQASTPELHIFRLGSVSFQVNGRIFDAFLEKQTAPATDTPFSLVITEELPDGMYVYSEEILHSEPSNIWSTNFTEESGQLLAVTYPDSQKVDILTVNAEGVIKERYEITTELFTTYPDVFTYTDAVTGEMRRITMESGEYVDSIE